MPTSSDTRKAPRRGQKGTAASRSVWAPKEPPSSHRRNRAWWLLLIAVWTVSGLYVGHGMLRGWVPHDEGTLGQSAERVLAGELPHRDFDDPYTGGLSYAHALAFRLAGTNLVALRWGFLVAFLAWLPAVYYIASCLVSPVTAAGAVLLAVVWSVPNYFASLAFLVQPVLRCYCRGISVSPSRDWSEKVADRGRDLRRAVVSDEDRRVVLRGGSRGSSCSSASRKPRFLTGGRESGRGYTIFLASVTADAACAPGRPRAQPSQDGRFDSFCPARSGAGRVCCSGASAANLTGRIGNASVSCSGFWHRSYAAWLRLLRSSSFRTCFSSGLPSLFHNVFVAPAQRFTFGSMDTPGLLTFAAAFPLVGIFAPGAVPPGPHRMAGWQIDDAASDSPAGILSAIRQCTEPSGIRFDPWCRLRCSPESRF